MSIPFSIRDSRQFKAFTGLTEEQFEKLEKVFGEVWHEDLELRYEEGVGKGERKRKPGGGQKGKLPTMESKLSFLLFYIKVYPSFDILGGIFDLSRSKARENINSLMPILHKTLEKMGVVPRRDFDDVGEMKKALGENIDKIIIDVTERPCQRPKDSEKQRSSYSGKKKATCSKTPS